MKSSSRSTFQPATTLKGEQVGRSQRLHGPSKFPSVTAKEPMTQKGEVPLSLSLLSLLLTEACAHFLVPQQRQSSSSEERSEPNWMVNGKESLAGGSGRERETEKQGLQPGLSPQEESHGGLGLVPIRAVGCIKEQQ